MLEGPSLLLCSGWGEDLSMAQVQKKHRPFAQRVLKGTPKARPSRGVRGHAPLGKILKSWMLESLW